MNEGFKPIPVRAPSSNRLFFIIRCIFDLQMLTVFRFLSRWLSNCKGRVLDVGAGESPWRELFSKDAEYLAVDVYDAEEFGMKQLRGIDRYDGKKLPYDDACFDYILCTEVIEHVADPELFLKDINRVLRLDGQLILTMPWSARLHHIPNDYQRFTKYGLKVLMEKSGFSLDFIEERGNDVAVISNKMIVLLIRLLKPINKHSVFWTWIVAVIMSPVVTLFLLAAHFSLIAKLGSSDDPLGYGVVARKTSCV